MTNSKSIIRKGIITVFSFLAIVITVNGQNSKINITKDAYYHEGVKYKIQDLGTILYEDGEAFVLYNEGKQKYSSAKTFGIVSITSLGAGFFSLSLIEKSDNLIGGLILLGPNAMLKGMGIVFIGTGVITGVVSLSKRTKGLYFMEKAIGKFNSKIKPTSPQPNLQLSVTGNGAGLVLNF